jgi:hypothetical protein
MQNPVPFIEIRPFVATRDACHGPLPKSRLPWRQIKECSAKGEVTQLKNLAPTGKTKSVKNKITPQPTLRRFSL